MTLHHFEVFVAVCEEKTMHAAAQKLHLSQPSISKIIADMEAYYCIRLFERVHHRLYLTPIGETVLEHARHILKLFGDMEDDIRSQGQTHHIRIGSSVSVGTCLLPPLIARLTQQELPISYEVTVNNTSKIEELVNTFALDAALVEGQVDNPNLIIRDVAEDELVLAVSSAHPLAGQSRVTYGDVERYPFITREDGSSQRNQLELYLQNEGIRLTSHYVCSSVEAVKQALRYTPGIAALSRLMITDEIQKGVLTTLPLEGTRIRRSIRLIYHKDKYITPAMNLFFRVLQEHIQNSADHTAP